MRSLLVVIAAAVLMTACGTGDTRALGPAAPSALAARTASPTPTFDMADMMGFYPQQTVLVADVDKVSAITLLNHFTRYEIPTRGKAQVAVESSVPSDITWLYVLDGIESAPLRLRAFDLATGIERSSRSDIGSVASTQRAIASAGDGRVLLLKSDAGHAWIDAYERSTLKPLGTVMEKAGCGDRILASQARLAIVCLATGEVAVDALGGAGTSVVGGPPGLAGAAMDSHGEIWLATTDRQLAAIASGTVTARTVVWPAAWTGTVLPDGIALATAVPSLVIAQTDTEGSWLRVLATNVMAQRNSIRIAGRLSGAPQFGIMVLYPFAYFTSGGSVRHVQIDQGMLETMTELGPGATIVAVVER